MAQLSVVLESVGGAAENHGSRLGEFQLVGSYRGRPSYVLRDTVGQEDRFLYWEGGWWKVGSMLGGAAAYLAHQGASQDPPETGWLYADGQGGWQEDPSLVLRGGQLEPCQEVLVMAAGEARRLQGDTVGAYLPTGGWSSGRPVYRQVTAQTRPANNNLFITSNISKTRLYGSLYGPFSMGFNLWTRLYFWPF